MGTNVAGQSNYRKAFQHDESQKHSNEGCRECKSSSSPSFCLVAEPARPFPHLVDVIKATLWW